LPKLESKQEWNNNVHNLWKVTGGIYNWPAAFSDFYYIPKSFSSPFSVLAKVFFQHQVFLEMAIPAIVYTLDPNLIHTYGYDIWGESRFNYHLYNTSVDWIHPVKTRVCQTSCQHIWDEFERWSRYIGTLN